ncbi:MAG: phosphotransferase [Elusimicrobiota bacterium]|jgi:tRNA A-37 threonylcarbamoyl transferase component Bud32|nr:phosphotransferase [Elusimicrobiota bacterium]
MDNLISKGKGRTIYTQGSSIVKVIDTNVAKISALNEALNQARIEETGLSIPKILEVKKIDEKWALVMEYIKGEKLEDLMKKNPSKIDEYINLLVDLQLQVHSKRVPRLDSLRDKMHRKISAAKEILDATLRYDLHERVDSAPKHDKVCHGDFIPANIIISQDGKPYIIGWSHVARGNGAADAALTFLHFYITEQDEIGDKYLKIYTEKSGTSKQYVQEWIPVVAAAKIMDYPEQTRELLMNFIDVVDSL